MNRLLPHLIFAVAGLVFNTIVSAALYNIVGTDQFVNGLPSTLTTKERAKLLTTTPVKTEASCLAGKCELVDKAKAKAKIKSIIASEVCPVDTTGTWPDCVPKVCEEPTEGTWPNCVQKTCKEPNEGTYPACVPKTCQEPTEGQYPACTLKKCDLPKVGTYPACALPPPPPVSGDPNIIQVGLMPAVDISKQITPAVGYSTLRVKPTTEVGPATGGAFRIVCTPSHMSNDDPIVYPGQQGAAHNHTFFGNTSIKFDTDVSQIANVGNSTCNGGIMNRSAYWVPSMIDTDTKIPKTPEVAIFYYKNGRVPAGLIKVPPKGLRMIAGATKATTAETSKANYTCLAPSGSDRPFYGWHKTIQNCPVGDTLQMHVAFPQCWDGKNLDSPDHQSHMAYTSRTLTTANKCPTTHPEALPEVTVNFNYKITVANLTKNWRLASDNYTTDLPGGYSSHADWINGWDEAFLKTFVANCLNKDRDCHAHLLGDGRMFN